MNWWESPKVDIIFAVGVSFLGTAADGQVNGWMLEGLFETEEEAVKHCVNDMHFVCPVPIGIMIGKDLPDGIYWPLCQTKEQGQETLDKYRKNKSQQDGCQEGLLVGAE
jgi:hypothetical protein